jgi:hypothetical protein
MIILTLVGSFMAFTGIILHSISRMIHEGVNIKKGKEKGEDCLKKYRQENFPIITHC